MEKLIINLLEGNIEYCDSEIVSKLYDIVKEGVNESESSLIGTIHCDHTYTDYIEYLENHNISKQSGVKKFHISADSEYILFKDSNVESALLNAGIGDGTGITVNDAANAVFTSSTFQDNTDITNFNEFGKFTRANTDPPQRLFRNCTNLTEIDLSNATKFVYDEFAFSNISTVNAPNLLSTVRCFYSCTNLKHVYSLGNTITEIPRQIFYNCTSLEDIILPSGITSIGDEAFYHCHSLVSVGDLSNCTVYGKQSINECENLAISTSQLYNAVTIGQGAFYKCSSISGELYLPNITSIGSWSFSGASSISKVTCLNKISTIPQAFMLKPYNTVTPSLTEVYLPYECTEIGRDAFSDCSNLTTIKQYTLSIDNWVEGQSPSFSHLFNIRILRNNCLANCNLTLTAQDLIDLEIIELGALRGNTFSSSIAFPNLTELGNWAMSLAKGISSVDFTGSTFTVMPQEAFGQVSTLTSVILPTTCVELSNKAFYANSNLLSVSNLNNVTKIGDWAFNGDNNLVIPTSSLSLNISHIGEYAFLNCKLTGDLVLSNLSVIYNQALLGTKLTSVDFTGSTFTKTPGSLFLNVSTLDHVIFSTSVIETERWLFYNCTNLRYAVFPTTSTITWNNSTFENCPSTCIIYVDDSKVSEVTAALSGKFSGQIKGISELSL